jgi:hypothetical protein
MTTSRLSDRLREIVRPRAGSGETRPGVDARRPAVSAEGRERLRLEDALGGEWRTLDAGRCFLVERRIAPDVSHGACRIGELAERLDRSISGTQVLVPGARAPLVFFDLETTGLNGGAGTCAFLVGFGSFDVDGSFTIRQYVMTHAGDERAMLQAVAAQLRASGALVSFNGKSFDAPLLETRFLFHRLTWPGAAIPHVDVLHPARRFWRSRVESDGLSCSLPALEQHVLDAARCGDVPGLEAPARYFEFIRSGDARPLAGVLDHNRFDLVSLAGLMVRLLDLIRIGAGGATTAREAFALGGVYERAGWPARASAAFERALELVSAETRATRASRLAAAEGWPPAAVAQTAGARLHLEILRALARSARRAGRHDEAARWWRHLLERPACPPEIAREATEALAVYHEHRQRDLEQARVFTLRALETRPPTVRQAAVQHRLARIERKLGERPTLLLGE